MLISIIIPTLNEEQNIESLISFLKVDPSFEFVKEIIVVDGGSSDETKALAQKNGAMVLHSDHRNRAIQMNLGATRATGDIYYFLHADTLPPWRFGMKIKESVNQGFSCGCFRLKFNWDHWFLKANSWFTRFNVRAFRFGDQSLFVTQKVFGNIGGFNTEFKLFEDQDIVSRLSKKNSFQVISDYVTTSARKYRQNGPYKLQLIYFCLYLLYTLGFSQETLVRVYQRLVPYPMI